MLSYAKNHPVDQLKELLNADDIDQIEKAERPPQLITFWLSHYLQQQYKEGHISEGQRIDINNQVNNSSRGTQRLRAHYQNAHADVL